MLQLFRCETFSYFMPGSGFELRKSVISHAGTVVISPKGILTMKDELQIFLLGKNQEMVSSFCDQNWLYLFFYLSDLFVHNRSDFHPERNSKYLL